MSTTALHLSPSNSTPAIGAALRALGTAIVATLFQPSPQRALSPSEEAEQVRALAASYSKTDRGFADDLFAAADRHEWLHDVR